MTIDPVPLVRHFSMVPTSETDSDEQEIRSIWSGRKRTGWNELEKEHRCVILAEAGAGKTHEMERRAKHLAGQGKAAFFIRIEDIKDDFESAFEVGNADALADWMNSGEDAWFFLDSVDEARLGDPRTFEKAIKHFAKQIDRASHRARVFISSRPYAWRARSDRNLIELQLPFKEPVRERPSEHEGRVRRNDPGESSEQGSALRVYMLEPLDEDDIRKFAEHRDTPEVDRLIIELQRTYLKAIAGRPFDLDDILSKWKADQTLDGRYELLKHNIDRHLKEINPDRNQRQPLNQEKAKRGARLLAAAVMLTGEPGIRVPDSTQSKGGIDAATVLGDWEPAEIQALLERAIFNDALYGLVRFRHREVRELLAAEWFYQTLNEGRSRNETEALFFCEQYGHSVIRPRVRPALPWLILFDPEMRRKALKISPEIAVEGGDAARLPLSERQGILRNIVQRIADDAEEPSARDNSAIARIAHLDLTDDALGLIKEHRDNDEAIFFLGRLAWQGAMTACVPVLYEIAGDPSRGVFARIAAARAVMTCGARHQRIQLWEQLIASHEALPRRLLADVLACADPGMNSVKLLLASLDKLEAHNPYEATGLGHSLHGFIDRLPIGNHKCTTEPLAALAGGMNEYLSQEPHIKQLECHLSQEFAWLLGPVSHAVERLVSARSPAALSPDACEILLKVPIARRGAVRDFYEHEDRLDELVPAWPELNDALFWRSVEEARDRRLAEASGRLDEVWQVQWIGHYWNFGVGRFGDVLGFIGQRDCQDDKLVALSLAHRLFMEADKPDCLLNKLEEAVEGCPALAERLNAILNPCKSQSVLEFEEREARRTEKRTKEAERRILERAEWVKHLKANPDVVRCPPGLKPGKFSNDQYCLLVQIERAGPCTSLADGADWKSLIPEFGKDVARAYREAAVEHWRHFTPGLRSEGHDKNEISYSLNFAMAGLQIEATEADNFGADLSEKEVRHALRYIVWEMNGFPGWLEQLHRTHPDLVLDAVMNELSWELARADPKQPVHYILHDLFHYAPWIHEFLAPSISAWMGSNEILNHEALPYSIDILLNGVVDGETVSKLAQSKIASGVATEQGALWYALWIGVDAEHGIPATEKWLSGLPKGEASRAAQLLIVRLMGTRRSPSAGHGCREFRNVIDLKDLYLLMHRHIRVQDDISRAGTGVYSPGLRDDAQDARSAIFNLLCEIPGKQTYVALDDLAADHPNSSHRIHLKKLAYRRAEMDADLEPWSARQVWEHDRHETMTPATHRQLFDLAVGRLNYLKDWVESGGDSPYKTWQRAADESEMRNLVAGWLNGHSSGRYTIAQEPELANKQKSDIWVQSPKVSPVPVELKVLDRGWSGPKLCERLRNQLVGDYLREETAGCGVFLLIWQGKSPQRSWMVNGRSVALSELCAGLEEFWESVSPEFPDVDAVAVILVDLTVRDAISAG